MSPNQKYIVIINDFYAYEVEVDVNIKDAPITEALKLFNSDLEQLKRDALNNVIDPDEVEWSVQTIRVYEKRN